MKVANEGWKLLWQHSEVGNLIHHQPNTWWHVVLVGIAHVSKAYLIPLWQPGLESVSRQKANPWTYDTYASNQKHPGKMTEYLNWITYLTIIQGIIKSVINTCSTIPILIIWCWISWQTITCGIQITGNGQKYIIISSPVTSRPIFNTKHHIKGDLSCFF